MRASFVLSLQTLASQAESDCSKLCDFVWWRTATTADVQAELLLWLIRLAGAAEAPKLK